MSKQAYDAIAGGLEEVVDGLAGWQPMDSAPRDGTEIRATIIGIDKHYTIAWMTGLLDSDEKDCGSWYITDGQDPPDCWTDGVCWDVNAEGQESAKPFGWMPLPTPPSQGG